MRLTCEQDSEIKTALRVCPEGMLHAEGAAHLWEVLSGRLSETANSLLINMESVVFLSSAGVGTLVRLLSRAQQLGGAVTLCGCCQRVEQILQVVGLMEVLNVREGEADARARLRELGSA